MAEITAPHLIQGQQGEQLAKDYLLKQGLVMVEQNFKCKMGELDLIMKDKDCYVFVEVRYRTQNDYGGGIESITPSKQRKIIKTTMFYLQQVNLYNRVACRFDVFTIDGDGQIEWIKDAFQVRGYC